MTEPLDIVAVDAIEVDTIVGIYPPERLKPQKLRLSVEAHIARRGGALSQSVDYARLTGDLRFILEHAHFELLESALETLATHVLSEPTADAPRARVERVRLVLEKPYALGGQGVPRLVVERQGPRQVQNGVIFEGEGVGIYRVHVAPGAKLTLLTPSDAIAYDMTCGAGMTGDGAALARGYADSIPAGCAIVYANASATEQTFLRIIRPAIPPTAATDDEIALACKRPRTVGRLYYPFGDH